MIDALISCLKGLAPGETASLTRAEFDETFRSFESEDAKSAALNVVAQTNGCVVKVTGEDAAFVIFRARKPTDFEAPR